MATELAVSNAENKEKKQKIVQTFIDEIKGEKQKIVDTIIDEIKGDKQKIVEMLIDKKKEVENSGDIC